MVCLPVDIRDCTPFAASWRAISGVSIMTNRALYAVLPLALLVTACEASKSSNPLSPTVAGPIPGVNISAPKPLEPNGAQVAVDKQPLTLLLENASSNGARPLSYDFEVAIDAGFTNTVFVRQAVEAGSAGRTSVRLPDPLATDRSYYWRARAADGANSGPYSAAANFKVYSPVVIEAPTPTAPIGNQTTSSLQPKFSWNNAQRTGPAGVIAYVLELADTDSFANKLAVDVAEQSNATSYTAPSPLTPSKQYYWHVRAYDPSNSGPWSVTQTFKTPATPTPPPDPVDGGGTCSPTPTTGPAVIACASSQYPAKLAAGVSDSQRVANMEFMRDRVIEIGICGGMDIGWNLKRGGPSLSSDAIVWRHNGFDDIIDIGFSFDDTSRPLQLQWVSTSGAFYKTYTPRPTCK